MGTIAHHLLVAVAGFGDGHVAKVWVRSRLEPGAGRQGPALGLGGGLWLGVQVVLLGHGVAVLRERRFQSGFYSKSQIPEDFELGSLAKACKCDAPADKPVSVECSLTSACQGSQFFLF
ncbi:hypothetical protein BJ166DRAFT_493777 [Pestalotiopsis sp. NC0098]|nr:hypothetical protein BJ166DRAFT_493777 [Pestalotiopsis sp. NC0098]